MEMPAISSVAAVRRAACVALLDSRSEWELAGFPCAFIFIGVVMHPHPRIFVENHTAAEFSLNPSDFLWKGNNNETKVK